MENFERTEDGKGIVLPDVDLERYPEPSTAYLAKVKLAKDGKVIGVTLPKGRTFTFHKPGMRVESKRLVTVKAMHPDGRLVQLPLEGQINNQAASPSDFVGLRKYVRRNYTVYFDFETGRSAFCKTWGCWAQSDPEFDDFCTPRHKGLTSPEDETGQFGSGATGTDSVYRSL